MARPLRTELEKFIVKTDPVIPPQTYTVGSTYDAAGRRTGITYPDGTTVTRTYTERDQLAQIDYNGDMVATYTHDSSGRRTTRTLGDTPNTQTQWQYTRADNLTTAIQSDISGASFTYTYDANKNKLTETISAPMTDYGFSTTTYDPTDRLTSWNRADGNKNQTWALSQVGDWTTFTETGSTPSTETRTHTSVHELATLDTTPLVHDAKGNLTFNQNTHTYTWDFDNRLTSATVAPNTHSYTYDALGRRVSKTVADGANVETTVFVYSGQQVLTEYLGNVVPTSAERKFVYATYIDEPILMLDRTATGSIGANTDEKFYYHQNTLCSVVTLTNQSGAILERYSYTAYGHLTLHDTTGIPLSPQPAESLLANPFTYTGRRLNGESGLYYYRARYYDPGLGRFLNRDPLGQFASPHVYAYVSGNPLFWVDSSGLAEEEPPTSQNLAWADFPEVATVPAGTSHRNAVAMVSYEFSYQTAPPYQYDCKPINKERCAGIDYIQKILKTRTVNGKVVKREVVEEKRSCDNCPDCYLCKANDPNPISEAKYIKDKSWKLRGTSSAAILEHERLHLRMVEMTANFLRKALAKLEGEGIHCIETKAKITARSDLETKFEAKYNHYNDELGKAQKKYDRETGHGGNPAQQAKWERAINDRYQSSLR